MKYKNKLLVNIFYFLSNCIFFPVSAAMFHTIDTTSPLLCTFSSQFQNRIMVEGGRIQTIIAADEERLSILMEDLSGQAFICPRDHLPDDTTVSVITESGLVQDLQITFIKRSSEVVILYDPNLEKESSSEESKAINEELNSESRLLAKIDNILKGSIPEGYMHCCLQPVQWKVKNGIILETITQLVGENEVITVYKVSNIARKKITLQESELQFQGCQWIFLDKNILLPKQTVIAMISESRDDQ